MNQNLPWMFVLTAMQTAVAADFPVNLNYVTSHPPEIGKMYLNITVSETQTIFQDGDRKLVIDYAKLEVRSIDDDLTEPHVYPLVDPNDSEGIDQEPPGSTSETTPKRIDDRQPKPGVPIADQIAAMLDSSRKPAAAAEEANNETRANSEVAAAISRYEIKNESAGAPVRGFAVSAKTVWFGRGFLNSRVMGKIHFAKWGRRFTERRLKFWVTKDHADYRVLDKLAASRIAILRANPMLAHVDWTLLIPELGGLPVALEERGRNMLMRIELVTPAHTYNELRAP